MPHIDWDICKKGQDRWSWFLNFYEHRLQNLNHSASLEGPKPPWVQIWQPNSLKKGERQLWVVHEQWLMVTDFCFGNVSYGSHNQDPNCPSLECPRWLASQFLVDDSSYILRYFQKSPHPTKVVYLFIYFCWTQNENPNNQKPETVTCLNYMAWFITDCEKMAKYLWPLDVAYINPHIPCVCQTWNVG